MQLKILIIAILALSLSGCVQQPQNKKASFENPNPKKYTINHNGCLKRKPLWSQLGI